jgi:hypothetical protein
MSVTFTFRHGVTFSKKPLFKFKKICSVIHFHHAYWIWSPYVLEYCLLIFRCYRITSELHDLCFKLLLVLMETFSLTLVRVHRVNPLAPELNPSAQRCLTRFLLGIFLLESCISLIYAWKTNKYTNYSFSLLIMYGSSYMFRHYIAILRERS